MSDYNFTCEPTDDMRGVFLRIFEENTLEDGTVTHYTEADIKKFVSKYWDGNSEIGYARHDKDTKSDGVLKRPHFHIAMYRTVRGNYHFKALKNALPGVHIEKMKGSKEEMFAYLIHATFPDRHQYDVSEVVLNFPVEQFEDYVDIAIERYKQKEERFAAKAAKRDENKIMRHAILLNDFQRKKHDLEMEQLFLQIQDDIFDGKITPRTYKKKLHDSQDDALFRQMHAHYSAKIEKAFKTYYEWKKENVTYRDLTVWVIEGNGGKGKTLLAQQICEANNLLYSISSEKRDPFSTVKPDDDVFICNDFRDSTLPYDVFLHTMEPHLVSESGSRFYNKAFYGKLIIITTPKSIDNWYDGVEAKADSKYDGKSTRSQFNRRIQRVIKIQGEHEEYFSVFEHHDDGTQTLIGRYHNPVALLDDESKKKHEYLLNDAFLADAIRSMADKLGVLEKYEDKVANSPVPMDYLGTTLSDTSGRNIPEEDISLIMETAVNDLLSKGASRVDAIDYLKSRLEFYTKKGAPDGDIVQLGGIK